MGVFDFFKKKESADLPPNFDTGIPTSFDTHDPLGGSHDPLGGQFGQPSFGAQAQPGFEQPFGQQSMNAQSFGQSPSASSSFGQSSPASSAFQSSTLGSFPNQQQFPAPASPDMQKDMQILSLKLDAIKAELDSMNQRIKNIESIAEKEQQIQAQIQKKWY